MATLNERQAYLSEMGVSQWYSRFNLVGAQESPQIVYLPEEVRSPETLEGAQSSPDIMSALSSDIKPGASAREILSVSEQQSSPSPKHELVALTSDVENHSPVDGLEIKGVAQSLEDPAPGSSDSHISALSQFSLQLYKAGDCLIISETEGVLSHSDELSLLKNILDVWAKVSNQKSLLCQYEIGFHWPVFKSHSLQSKQHKQVNDLLMSWLQSHVKPGNKSFLYFGAKYGSVCDVLQSLFQEERVISLRFPYSLAELLRYPAGKAEIWKILSSKHN